MDKADYRRLVEVKLNALGVDPLTQGLPHLWMLSLRPCCIREHRK
jgi:hypothetical protein